jgi:hypothetical protein
MWMQYTIARHPVFELLDEFLDIDFVIRLIVFVSSLIDECLNTTINRHLLCLKRFAASNECLCEQMSCDTSRSACEATER